MTLIEIEALALENGITLRDMLLYLQLNPQPMAESSFYIQGVLSPQSVLGFSTALGNEGVETEIVNTPILIDGDTLGSRFYKIVGSIGLKVTRDSVLTPAVPESFVIFASLYDAANNLLHQKATLALFPASFPGTNEFSINAIFNYIAPAILGNGCYLKFSTIFNNGENENTVGSIYWVDAATNFYLERTNLPSV